MRAIKTAAVVAVVLGVAAAFAAAQGNTPTVTVTASGTAVAATPTPVRPGATRFDFVSSAQRDVSVFLAAVKPGRTAAEATAALHENPDAALEIVDVVASAALTPGASRAVTIDVKPDTTYLLVNDAGQENPANWIVAPLATGGAPTGVTAPAPDATVTMRDVRFQGSGTLPRDGTVRMRNVGWAPHFAIAFQLRRGARQAAVGRAIRRNQERRLGRLVNFRNTVELTDILSRNAVADQEVTFNQRGRYVMVCFFEGPNTQGMYRLVRVR